MKIKNENYFIIQDFMRSVKIKCLENNRIYSINCYVVYEHRTIIFLVSPTKSGYRPESRVLKSGYRPESRVLKSGYRPESRVFSKVN